MSTTRLPELPVPTLYAHELLANRGGVWLACADLDIVKQSHDPGETGEEILHLMTADQMHAYGLAVWKAAMEQAAQAVTIAGGGPWTSPRNPAAVIRSLPLPEDGGTPQ